MATGLRQCLECGGELVMVFRPSESGRGSPTAGTRTANSTWRCGTCGGAFTAEQLRAGKKLRNGRAGAAVSVLS